MCAGMLFEQFSFGVLVSTEVTSVCDRQTVKLDITMETSRNSQKSSAAIENSSPRKPRQNVNVFYGEKKINGADFCDPDRPGPTSALNPWRKKVCCSCTLAVRKADVMTSMVSVCVTSSSLSPVCLKTAEVMKCCCSG